MEEVVHGREWIALMCREYRVRRACREPFDTRQRHANGLAARHEGRSRLVYRRRQQLQPEPMAFEDIDQRMIKPFAVRQYRRHEFGGEIAFEPRGLIRLDAV